MYTEILGKLSVGDTFTSGDMTYTVTKKPFGKWVDVTDETGRAQSFKSAARVAVISQRSTDDSLGEETEIDGLF